MRAFFSAASLAVLALAACGDDGGGGPDGGIDVSSLTYDPCTEATLVGGFEVLLDPAFTAAQGQVYNAVTPSQIEDTIVTDGACAIVKAPTLSCAPACAVGMTCNAAGTCVPTPVAQDVGTVTIAGLKAAVSMAPRAPTYFYNYTGTLPHPGFDPEAGLRVDVPSAGGTAVSLLGWGIDPLAGVPDEITLERGQPLALTWTAPAHTGPARFEISLNINGHGLVGEHLECVVDDTGSFTIPEALITRLFDDGRSGFPSMTVQRSTADSASTPLGCVEFRVHARKTVEIVIPGLESCTTDEECTPPETCQGDLTCG